MRKNDFLALLGTFLLASIIIFSSKSISNDIVTYILFLNIRDHPEVASIAESIRQKCLFNKIYISEECLFYEVENFIFENVSYRKDTIIEETFKIHKDPLYTLKYGGDCEGMAILAIDILKSLGRKNLYLVRQDQHICWGAMVGKSLRLYGCDLSKPINFIRRVG